MEDLSLSFSVKMKTRYIFRFLYVNSYSGLRGIINYCISGIAVLVMIYGLITHGKAYAYPYDLISWIVIGLVALAFTVIDPGLLMLKAFQQVKTNAAFKEPIDYAVSEEKLCVSQGEQTSEATWDYVLLAKETKDMFLLFTGNNNAVILPKEFLNGKAEAMRELLLKVLPEERRQLKKIAKED